MSDFRLAVSFSDQSPSYTYGFEAGMIYQRMLGAETCIEVCARAENEETIRRMAADQGYDFSREPTAYEGWIDYVLVKRRSKLSVVRP